MAVKSWSRAPKDRSHLWEGEDLSLFESLGRVPTLLEVERKLILHALKAADGCVLKAAKSLMVSTDKVYKCVNRYAVVKRRRGLLCVDGR